MKLYIRLARRLFDVLAFTYQNYDLTHQLYCSASRLWAFRAL